MKSAPLLLSLLLVLGASTLLSGCASELTPEDQNFFYSGWKNPKSREADMVPQAPTKTR